MKQTKLIIIAVVVMGVAFVLAAVLYQAQRDQQQTQQATQNLDALIKAHSPRKGDAQAKVTIVEFLDPACETCKRFHPLVGQLLQQYPGKVNLVVRYAPLHPGSDEMVKILDAAYHQGQFWDMLELMFDTQQAWASHHNPQPQVFWNYMTQYGFDVEQYRRYVNSPAAEAILQQEIADGRALGANKTPTFFVNGQPLLEFGYPQLQQLVAEQVRLNYD